MPLIERIAELLADFFLSFCQPKDGDKWTFFRGHLKITVTVSVEKDAMAEKVELADWVLPEYANSN